MAYDETLARRVRAVLGDHPGIGERKMFGGVAFLVDGKMFVGVVHDDLMVRVGPDGTAAALGRAHARPMDFTGRPMNGFVYVGAAGTRTTRQLAPWVARALAYVGPLTPRPRRRSPRPGPAPARRRGRA